MKIKEILDSYPIQEKLSLRDEIVSELGICLSTFYYKLKNGRWSVAQVKIIAQILNRDLIDLIDD